MDNDHRVHRLGDGASEHGKVTVVAKFAGDGVGSSVDSLQAFKALSE